MLFWRHSGWQSGDSHLWNKDMLDCVFYSLSVASHRQLLTSLMGKVSCSALCSCSLLYTQLCRWIAGLVVHRFPCCTAVSSMVRVDCCHAMVGKRMRKMRAVTSSHSGHALFVLGNGTCLFCLPARLLCAVAKLDFQIKKPVGDQDSSFLLPFNNHPCLLFRESSIFFLTCAL